MTKKRELEIQIRQLKERIDYWGQVNTGSPDVKRSLLQQLTVRLHQAKAQYAELIGK